MINKTEDFIHNRFGYCYYEVKEGRAIIYNLYVHPEYRRQGHAEKLLKFVVLEIRMMGHEGEIEIEAKPREDGINKDALIKFYQDFGLKVLA